MDGKAILKEALDEIDMNQSQLAREMGVARPTMSTSLRRDNISLDLFTRILTAMGYAVMVGRTENGTFVPMWQVDSVKPKREQRMKAERTDTHPAI